MATLIRLYQTHAMPFNYANKQRKWTVNLVIDFVLHKDKNFAFFLWSQHPSWLSSILIKIFKQRIIKKSQFLFIYNYFVPFRALPQLDALSPLEERIRRLILNTVHRKDPIKSSKPHKHTLIRFFFRGFESESFQLKFNHLIFKCNIYSVKVDLHYLKSLKIIKHVIWIIFAYSLSMRKINGRK